MGGGPVEEGMEETAPIEPIVYATEAAAPVVGGAAQHHLEQASDVGVAYAPSHVGAASSTSRTEAEAKPVLTSMATGGIVGGLAGSFMGTGTVLGTTLGAVIGASLASRDDAMGAKTRNAALAVRAKAEEGVTRALERVQQEPIGRDLTEKLSSMLQVVSDMGERYRVGEKVELAAEKAVEIASPLVQTAYSKVLEHDKHGLVDRATTYLRIADKNLGVSRSIDAAKRELRDLSG